MNKPYMLPSIDRDFMLHYVFLYKKAKLNWIKTRLSSPGEGVTKEMIEQLCFDFNKIMKESLDSAKNIKKRLRKFGCVEKVEDWEKE